MNILKNIKISGILTPSQMIHVKGGADNGTSNNGNGNVKDDKRRDRPGGGITTL
jgi:hypothetical protein